MIDRRISQGESVLDFPYLSDPVFLEINAGPMIDTSRPDFGRSPSIEQICQRAALIRRVAFRSSIKAHRHKHD